MTVVANLPRSVYPAQTINLGPVSVPQGATRAFIIINRFAWPNAGQEVARFRFEFSLDGGSTWAVATPGTATSFEISLNGGQVNYKGNPDSPSGMNVPIPGNPSSTQRSVRVIATLLVALDASATVDLS